MRFGRVQIKPPITADALLASADGALVGVRDLALLSPSALRAALPNEIVARSARLSGTTGQTTWPGAEEWLQSALSGRSTSVLDRNTYVVSRLYALDALADPNNHMRWLKEDEGTLSLFGAVSDQWSGGDQVVASWQSDVPPIRVPEENRRWAWAQIRNDLALLSIRRGDVSRAESREPPPITADVMINTDVSDLSAIAERPDLASLLCRGKYDQCVAESPGSSWAFEVAMTLVVRKASREFSLTPPPTPEHCATPKMIWEEMRRQHHHNIAMGVGAGLLFLAGIALDRAFPDMDQP